MIISDVRWADPADSPDPFDVVAVSFTKWSENGKDGPVIARPGYRAFHTREALNGFLARHGVNLPRKERVPDAAVGRADGLGIASSDRPAKHRGR